MRADAKHLLRHLRHFRQHGAPVERPAVGDAAFQPRLAGRGERRIERPEALADDADAVAVDVVALLEDVDHRADDAAPLVRDRQAERGFALARTVERERREAAGGERLGPGAADSRAWPLPLKAFAACGRGEV